MTQDTVSSLNAARKSVEELLKPDVSGEGSLPAPNNIVLLKEQLRAAQDSIKFLQNEHALMLQGLHAEIEQLHDLCRDLQFRCEAGGCLLPDNDFFKCSPACLEQKVEHLLKENSDLKRRLSESHQAIDILDQKEKLALWQHHQELEQRDSTILKLEKELEAKCTTVHQLTTPHTRKKKAGFWRRFTFAHSNAATAGSQPSTSTDSSVLKSVQRPLDHLSKEDLPSEIQNSLLQSFESQYQSYSSYSSLSDKSVSDDEGFGQRCCEGDEVAKDPKKDSKLTVRLPPIHNLPTTRQLVRHQLRMANKVTADSLAIDQIPSPSEVPVKRLNKAS